MQCAKKLFTRYDQKVSRLNISIMKISRFKRYLYSWATHIIKCLDKLVPISRKINMPISIHFYRNFWWFVSVISSISPDLALFNCFFFSLFSKVKIHLKGKIWRCGGHKRKYNSAGFPHTKRGFGGASTNAKLAGISVLNIKETILKRINISFCSFLTW